MMLFIKTVLKGIKRRKRDIWFVSMATFIAVLCMTSASLFQDIMNRYLMERNFETYGEWIISAVNREIVHPYFGVSGDCHTGRGIIKEDGNLSGEYLGSVDEEFIKLGNLSFYEGRRANAKNEIVMTLDSLANLGYDFELGQTIYVKVASEEQMIEKEFTLVGTIENFSGNWKNASGFPLPSCLIVEEALKDMGGSVYTTHFYQLDRTYEDIDAKELVEPYMQVISDKYPVTYNSYVYDNMIWGSQEMFQNIQYILIVIAVLVLSYLMMSYVTKRRKWYYQLRCTGAGRSQIWLMIFVEGIYGTVPWAAAAMILPHIVGVGICHVAAKKAELPNFYRMNTETILWQAATVFGLILIALLAACLSSSDKRIGSNVYELKKGQLKRLRKAAKKRKNVARHFQKRLNRIHPFQRIAMAVFSIVVCSLLLLCMHRISKEHQTYEYAKDLYTDFSASKRGNMVYEECFMWPDENGELIELSQMEENEEYTLHDGMNRELEMQLEMVEGLKSVIKSTEDEVHFLDWEDREESPIFQQIEQKNKERRIVKGSIVNDYIIHQSYYYDNYEDALEINGSLIETKKVDREAFEKGEQVLILLYEETQLSGKTLRETTLQTGDIVTMVSTDLPGRVSAEAVVIQLSREEIYNKVSSPYLAQRYNQPYTLIASTAFAKRVAEADGKEFQYNTIKTTFEPNVSYESTMKRLTTLFQREGFTYSSGWEQKNIAREQFVHNLCAYGVLFLVILFVYLILLMNLNQIKNLDRTRKYRLLKRIGMSDSHFLKMAVKDGIKDALWLVLGIPISYGLFLAMEWNAVTSTLDSSGTWSSWIGDYTLEPKWIVLGSLKDNTSIGYVIVFVVFLTIAVVGIVYLAARSSIKKDATSYFK